VVALNGDFAALFPASNISGHLNELELFSQEEIHLLLDGIFFTVSHESSAEINSGHGNEVDVSISVATHHTELGVEQVITVTTVCHTIIDDWLEHDVQGSFGMESKILTVAGDDLSVLLESILDGGTIGALVLDETLLTGIQSVVAGSDRKFVVPVELVGHSGLLSQKLNGLWNCLPAFFGAHGGRGSVNRILAPRRLLVVLNGSAGLEQVAIKSGLHGFEMTDETLGIRANFVDDLEDLFVKFDHLISRLVVVSSRVHIKINLKFNTT
jgi:hypothetical protein